MSPVASCESGCVGVLSVGVEQHLQPAGAGGDELSGVAGAPTLSETDPDAVGVPGPFLSLWLHAVLRHPARTLIVKHLEGETRHHPPHAQPTSARQVQSGWVDEHRVLAAVVDPHSIGLTAQHDAETDFTANLLYVAAATVPSRSSTSSVAVVPVRVRCGVTARVLAAAVVGVGMELAEAEARALR